MLLFCHALALFILCIQPQSWSRPGVSACPGGGRQPSSCSTPAASPCPTTRAPRARAPANFPFFLGAATDLAAQLSTVPRTGFLRAVAPPAHGDQQRATSVSPACCLPGGSVQQERPPLSNGRGKRRIGDGLESRLVRARDGGAVGQDGMSWHSCNPSWFAPQLARVGLGKYSSFPGHFRLLLHGHV